MILSLKKDIYIHWYWLWMALYPISTILFAFSIFDQNKISSGWVFSILTEMILLSQGITKQFKLLYIHFYAYLSSQSCFIFLLICQETSDL